jgi:hypothetical protein
MGALLDKWMLNYEREVKGSIVLPSRPHMVTMSTPCIDPRREPPNILIMDEMDDFPRDALDAYFGVT